jgi:Leucine-rich repeat (LRR) protein
MHPAAPLTPESQQKALPRIAAALDHNNVLRQHSWERYSSNDYCSWTGVGCGAKSPSVAALNLDTAWGIKGLQGTLPAAAAFAGLDELTDLSIKSQPGIAGTLPADWSSLKQLQDVWLGDMSVTGSIPTSWGDLSMLHGLAMFGMRVGGEVPGSFEKQTSLSTLVLVKMQLSGTLPASLSKLKRLKILDLSSNRISGTLPDAFQALTQLETLHLSQNALTGAVPASWASMSSLRELTVSDNPGLKGCLPATWKEYVIVEFTNTSITGFC